jgi:hypothetical protein
MTTLKLSEAFFHVIDAHRWLAASGCNWNLLGKNAASGTKESAHKLLPNIDVMVLDSLLLHARSLIDFYTMNGRSPTDIVLRDFGISIDPHLFDQLTKYKNSIEVHSLHLTDYRDLDYRTRHTSGKGATRGRPDWNDEAVLIVEVIFKSLEYASEQKGRWQTPFRELYKAAVERYRNLSYNWPTILGEKSAVYQYLDALGL